MELYYAPYSPPSRAARLTAAYLGLDLKLNFIDILKGEQFDPDYAEVNPDKKVPFLIDEDFKLGESRAIMVYLAEKYGRNSRFLPSDPASRALVNQAMYFDQGTLYKSITSYYFPVVFKMEDAYVPERYERLKEVFGILDGMLENQDFVAGRNLTVADLTIVCSVTTAEAFGFELDRYKNIVAWVERVSGIAPGYQDINVEGVEMLKRLTASDEEEENEEEAPEQEEPPAPEPEEEENPEEEKSPEEN